jgi:hypothetical protein
MQSNATITEKKKYRKHVANFKKQQEKYLLTSRFNNETVEENRRFRSSHEKVGCIYCAPNKITDNIPCNKIMFVLEMNNDENEIIGIGMLRNHSYIQRHNVYAHNNYNRYIYMGKHRIDRKDMTQEELTIMKVFDRLCFKGNHHVKRGQGLKQFPSNMLYNCLSKINLLEFVNNMFKKRITQKEN